VPCGTFALEAFDNAGITPSIDTFEPDVRAHTLPESSQRRPHFVNAGNQPGQFSSRQCSKKPPLRFY